MFRTPPSRALPTYLLYVGLDAIPLKETSEGRSDRLRFKAGPTPRVACALVPPYSWDSSTSLTSAPPHSRGPRAPSPTNACGIATVVPMQTAPVSVSDSHRWRRSTNLGKKRNTPRPHLRAPRPGCRLATAQRSCCHLAEPMDKPGPSRDPVHLPSGS